MTDRLYDVHDVAALLRCTERTVRNYIRTGQLHGAKTARKWYFSEDQINQFLSSGAEVGYSKQLTNHAEVIAAAGESDLSPDEARLLAMYRSLPDEGRTYLMQAAEITERGCREVQT